MTRASQQCQISFCGEPAEEFRFFASDERTFQVRLCQVHAELDKSRHDYLKYIEED